MTFKEITSLIKLVNEQDLSEFKIRDGEFELTIRSANYSKKVVASDKSVPSVIPIHTAPAVATPVIQESTAPSATPVQEEAKI